MKSSFVLLAQLLSATKGVSGRKKLQKIVHILQATGRVDFGLDFKLALYGAYSSDLRAQVEDLVDHKLVEELPTSAGGYPSSLFQATARLSDVLASLGEPSTPAWGELAETLNAKSAQELEAVSTVIYFRAAGLPDDEVERQFNLIKPHLKSLFNDAKSFSDELASVAA